MLAYIIRRLFLMIPTLLGIMLLNFVVVQFAPGGPVEQMIARIQGTATDATSRFTGSEGGDFDPTTSSQGVDDGGSFDSKYRGAQGLDPEFIRELERQFGFDKPAHERFLLMIANYIRFDFGESYFRDRPVIDLIKEKLPVSISLGLWTLILTYAVCIPLGISKAVRDGSRFDVVSSSIVIFGFAIPNFLFGVLLIVLFAGGRYFDWFPLRGLTSDDWDMMSWPEKIVDYFWHLALPITAMMVSGFATLTQLTKNSFLDEINKMYVLTARAKGLLEKQVLYGHVFRNAMLLVIAGFPAAFIGIFLTGPLLIETLFSLDGLGLLGFESVINRDYPVVFGALFIFSLIGLVIALVSDITYTIVDPRIDFEARTT